MFILYVDESGDPGPKGTRHQAVLGIAVHELQVQALASHVQRAIRTHLPAKYHAVNLHATEIRSGKGDFRGIPKATRQKILDDIFNVIALPSAKGIGLFASVVNKANLKPNENPYRIALEDVYNRFDWFLKETKKTFGEQRGIVVVESTKLQGTVGPMLDGWRKKGTSWASNIVRIVETPFFLDKGNTRLLELADFYSWGLFRKYELLDDSYFKKLEPHFYCGTKSIRIGLRHQRAPGGCGCPPCAEWVREKIARTKRGPSRSP